MRDGVSGTPKRTAVTAKTRPKPERAEAAPKPSERDGKSGDTRTRILNAAEEMFANHGYDGTTVREIMKLAHAKLALMSYYFNSKEELLDAVVQRRTTELAELRKLALAEALEKPHTLIDIIDACFRVYHTLYLDEDHGWRCYFRLVAQLSQMERWTSLIAKHFNEQSSWFLDEILKLAKGADEATVVRLWISVINVQLNLFARTSRITTFTRGGNDDPSREQVYKNLLTFTASGMAAVLGLEKY